MRSPLRARTGPGRSARSASSPRCCCRRRPGHRPDGQRAAGRDDPGPRLDEPDGRPLSVVGSRCSPSTTTCWSVSGRTWSPCRASPSRGRQSADGLTWTFKIREGMHWSDGDAGHRRGCALDVPVRPRRPRLRGRDPSASATSTRTLDERRHHARSRRPIRPTRRASRPTVPNDQRPQDAYIPILPKHIWEDVGRSHRRRPTSKTEPPGRRHRPVPGRRVADRPVHPLREEPELLEGRRRGRRGHHPDLLERRRHAWSRRSGPASSTTPVASTPTSSSASHPRRTSTTVTGTAQRLDRARLQHLRDRHREDHRGRWRLDHGPARPGLPGRAGLRDRQGGPRRAGPRRLRRASARPTCRRSRSSGTRTPADAADLRHRRSPTQKLDAAGYALDADGSRLDKEGKPINLRLYMPGLRVDLPDSGRVHRRTGSARSASQSTPQSFDSGHADRPDAPARGRGRANKADYDLFIWGWGGDVDPNSLLEIFTCDQIGVVERQQRTATRPTTSSSTQQNAATSESERQGRSSTRCRRSIYDEAPYHILFYDAAARTPIGPTGSRAGRTSRPQTACRCSATARRATRC